MPNLTPKQIFPNMTVDPAVGVTIPFSDLEGVSAVEADPDTGNASILFRGIVETYHGKIQALPANARPTKLTVTKGAQSITPGTTNQIRQPYTATFDMAASNLEVASET